MDELKDSFRSEGAARRAAANRALGERAAEAVQEQFVEKIPYLGIIAGYWPAGDELDIRPLLQDLYVRGHPICLPAMTVFGGEVEFRRWRPGEPLTAGPHAILQPEADADVVRPSMILLPLLAFDRRCNPVTDWVGPYARIHATLPPRPMRPLAVGIAFSGQRFDAVPLRALEHQIDYVVTESEVVERPVPSRWERVLAFLCGADPP